MRMLGDDLHEQGNGRLKRAKGKEEQEISQRGDSVEQRSCDLRDDHRGEIVTLSLPEELLSPLS